MNQSIEITIASLGIATAIIVPLYWLTKGFSPGGYVSKPRVMPPPPQQAKRYQTGACWLSARECFSTATDRLTDERVCLLLRDIRGMSKARSLDRIRGMLATGMIIRNHDGTLSRSRNESE